MGLKQENSSLDMILEEVTRQGLWVNNLFQIGPALVAWQSNVTDGLKFYEFGRGATPAEALRAALSKVT